VVAALITVVLATWCWDPVPNAGDYCIYWSTTSPTEWSECNRECFVPLTSCSPTECCEDGSVPQPDDDIVYYIVTARNIVGESPTEHGDVEPCP
jgi:hypothetical protein